MSGIFSCFKNYFSLPQFLRLLTRLLHHLNQDLPGLARIPHFPKETNARSAHYRP